jgi:hypothetical protein
MKRFVGLIGAILLGLVVATAQERTPKSDDAAEKVLLDNERALYEAVAKSDKAAFQSLVAPERWMYSDSRPSAAKTFASCGPTRTQRWWSTGGPAAARSGIRR